MTNCVPIQSERSSKAPDNQIHLQIEHELPWKSSQTSISFSKL